MKRYSFLKKAYELFLLAMMLIAALFAVPFLLAVLFIVVFVLSSCLFEESHCFLNRGVVMLQ